MDIDELRRANIRTLENDAGSATAMADKVGMTYSQYINLRDGAKDSRTGKRRGMRKETAWRFEDKTGKPRGWLDIDHQTGERVEQPRADDAYTRAATRKITRVKFREIEEVIRLMEATDNVGRAMALAAVKVALHGHKQPQVNQRK